MASDTKVREACRMRMPLDGADAQALEGALQQLERENAELRRDRDRYSRVLRVAERDYKDRLAQANRRAEAAEAREAELRNRLTNLSDPVAVKSKLDYFDPGEEWGAGYMEAMSRVRLALAGEKGEA